MFTGIIENAGRIVSTREVPGGRTLCVDAGNVADGIRLGDSVAVNGVCLTVTRADGDALDFDVIHETLRKTTLGDLAAGHRVNLERSLRAGQTLDGHFVQGHVDATATVERIEASAKEHIVWLRPGEHALPYIIPKGSVAIDGVSLTIAEVSGPLFSVALIPTTITITTFADMKQGTRVNIETDIIARTVVHHLQGLGSAIGGLTMDALKSAGMA